MSAKLEEALNKIIKPARPVLRMKIKKIKTKSISIFAEWWMKSWMGFWLGNSSRIWRPYSSLLKSGVGSICRLAIECTSRNCGFVEAAKLSWQCFIASRHCFNPRRLSSLRPDAATLVCSDAPANYNTLFARFGDVEREWQQARPSQMSSCRSAQCGQYIQ